MNNISDILKQTDYILERGFNKLNDTINSTMVSILKDGTKGKNITEVMLYNPTSGIYSYKFQPIYTATTQWTNQIVKDITNMLDNELRNLSNYLGIPIPRLNFIKEVQNNINNFSLQVPANVRQNFLNYVSRTVIEPTTEEMLFNISNMINKTMRQTELLMKESLAVNNRSFINKQYLKFETPDTLYQYTGAFDKRISKICAKLHSRIMTRKDWELIKPDIFTNGGHDNCRHSLDVVDMGDKTLKTPK